MRKVLVVMIVVLSLILAGLVGYIVYDVTHFTVEGESYAKYAKELDLREEEITIQHYLAVKSQLPDCRILWNVPLHDAKYSSDSEQLQLNSLAADDIDILAAFFPDLKKIVADSCYDYDLLEKLVSRVPGVEVAYKVDLGGEAGNYHPETASVQMNPGSYSYDGLMANLKHMPLLKSIHFKDAAFDPEEMAQLQEAYPDIAMTFTAEILGKEYDVNTTSLDLSALTPDQVDDVASKLGVLISLETVELMSSGTSRLTLADVKKLVEAAPNAKFHYVFDFYGLTVDSSAEEVIIKNITVDDDNFDQNLRAALDVLQGCKRVVLDSKGQYDKMWKKTSNEALAKIREDYRDKVNFVWRVYFGDNGSSLTDAEVIRAVYGLKNSNCSAMQYLEKVRYMDIGHNDFLTDTSFISGMVSLEAVIISGAPIESVAPFANCKNLKFLELANCIYIPDISPLKECTQLEMLNISFTTFTDMSVLNDLNLTHLTCVRTKIEDEVIEQYMLDHPDCWTVYEGEQPYGVGWRYDTDNSTLLPWYAKLDAEYHYISQRNIPNNIGWYLD